METPILKTSLALKLEFQIKESAWKDDSVDVSKK